MQVQLRTNLFHKLKFKNEWIYATLGETIFITCDQDKRSTNIFLEGVGILYLNETCKAYATRDILIPYKIETDTEHVDFVPNSRIKEPEDRYASLTTNILENKHVRTNQMFDLNLVAKSTSEIIKDVKTEQMRRSKRRHDYLLYVISAIAIICIVITIIRCIEKKPWCTINGTMRSRKRTMAFPSSSTNRRAKPVRAKR
ncbi:Envelope fusion protein [Aphis craccivora]|uniref:Envelope fusion protein n=1 Tax=Aphis craccivora TaxID=307492 RepID=A0A6G0VGW6_APHCR|nr:Envelope fusion protein [Aphis craccivora]